MDASKIKEYLNGTAEVLKKLDCNAIADIANALFDAKKREAMIFTAGNGGSASTASHTANDLLKGCRVCDRPGFRAMCLTDSTPIITCLSNDFCYEDALAIQLQTYAKSGDVLLAFSGSGNSENIVRAAKYAQSQDLTVIGFLGRDGGKLLPICNLYSLVAEDCMERIEDAHLAVEHALATLLREKLKAEI